MGIKDIFVKKNILPLIGLALTLFGLVMLVIAHDWMNLVWPVIILFLIFKGFRSTYKMGVLENTLLAAEEHLDEVRKNRDDYMFLYKEYWNKFDAKVSECSILEQKVRDLQAVAEMKDAPEATPLAAQKPVRKRQARRKHSDDE